MTKRRHFGSVRQTSAGRWQARYRGLDGQRRSAGTFKTKQEAQRRLSEIETELHRGAWFDPSSKSVLLRDYAYSWVSDHPKLSPTTQSLYRDDLLELYIVPQLGDYPVSKISPAVVRRWYSNRAKKMGDARLRQVYSLLRAILNTAVADGMLASNPCKIEGAGAVRTPERPYLSHSQAAELIEAMPEDMRVLVVVTLLAHLRRGELLGLRRGDVNLRDATIRIESSRVRARVEGEVVDRKWHMVEKSTKTGQGRTVHLPPEALDALRDHLKATGPAHHQDYLFKHRDGEPLEIHHLKVAWTNARAEVGLRAVHWHDLRHAGLTWAAQAGASLRELMARGGHASVAAAMGYQHAAQERDAELAARLSLAPSAEAQA